MHVHHEELSDATRYIERHQHWRLEETKPQFESYLRLIEKCHRVDPTTRMLEIGVGTGWFPLMCASRGLHCRGLEVSPQLVEFARKVAQDNGLPEPDIHLGNVEDTDLGVSEYDVIIAHSVWEHVERWIPATERVYRALRPGGAFVFSSTNRFAPVSFEYDFPLYGWLPDSWRYRLRVRAQGPDIMKFGIDFHQFTYPQLRREFGRIGFREIHDRVDFARPEEIVRPLKRRVVSVAKRSSLLKAMVLTFSDATMFLCVK
jgi:SAM-dependent methyltransferase